MKRRSLALAALCCACASVGSADEGGVSFWLPGFYGSFAALPGEPGWALSGVYLHSSASADGQLNRGLQITLGLDATADIGVVGPTYTFESQVLGGQLSLSLLGAFGDTSVTVAATLTGPNGNTISGRRHEELTGFGDLFPQATLKWNDGADNYMAYLAGGVPVGAYDARRLANLGIGHGAIDIGGGYTYLNPADQLEFSAVVGLTYNFENTDTDYQNGIDAHIEWGASYLVNNNLHVGLVGYALQQVTGDSGAGAKFGDFESRVFGAGPQIGYTLPIGDGVQAYANLRGYGEFGAENRAEGWNVWLTIALSRPR